MAINVEEIRVQYNGELRIIPKKMWQDNELEPAIVGEARVVVRRGSLLANIPDDVPFGTFCICVNLASIKAYQLSESESTIEATPTQEKDERSPEYAKAKRG